MEVTAITGMPTAAALLSRSTILPDTFPPGTLKSIVEMQARRTEADLRRLGILD